MISVDDLEINIITNTVILASPSVRVSKAHGTKCAIVVVPPSVHTAHSALNCAKGQGPPWQTLSSGFTMPKEEKRKDNQKVNSKLIIKGGGAGAVIFLHCTDPERKAYQVHEEWIPGP